MRVFTTDGPVRAEEHYTIPPLSRCDLDEVLAGIRRQENFIVHGPVKTGKTSLLRALRDRLTEGTGGAFRCVYANLREAQLFDDEPDLAAGAILALIAREARLREDDVLHRLRRGAYEDAAPRYAFGEALRAWREADPHPLVLLLDEVDALAGRTIFSLLRQIAAGGALRPDPFPESVVLCGVRDPREWRAHREPRAEGIEPEEDLLPLEANSLRLGNFRPEETNRLLAQHTEATGQQFEPDAAMAVWEQTDGQPWFVNALAEQACFRTRKAWNRHARITTDDILNARDVLVRCRATPIERLDETLREDRARRVFDPVIAGSEAPEVVESDLEPLRDLGLLADDEPVRPAHPIYTEVIARELSRWVQAELMASAPR